jgi:hypothetical protein
MPEELNEKKCCGAHKSARFILLLVGIIALAGIVTVSILRDRIVNRQYRSVTVTGQGRVSYNPDLAILTLGVQIDKVAKADEALNQLNKKVVDIIKAVKAEGVDDNSIQTQNYSLYPQYDYKDNVSVVSGYNANQQLIIKITGYDKMPDKLSKVIAAASKAGANQVNNLTFDASNLNELKQTARIAALKDAEAKGVTLADAAGVKLQEITGWYENYITPNPTYDYSAKGGMGAGGAATTVDPSVPAGSHEVVIEMNITYNIK